MEQIFNAHEAFELAEQIERNGGIFYRRAAEVVNVPSVKDFLLELASMEDAHESYFASLKRRFVQDGNVGFPDLDQQMLGYIQALVDGEVFGKIQDPELQIDSDTTLEELIEIALDFEKNTVIYFTTLKKLVPIALGKDKIDALIEEEIRHIAMLAEKLQEIQ